MKEILYKLIEGALRDAGITDGSFVVEHPTDLKMGDYSTNVGIKYGAKKQEIFAYIEKNKPEEVERVELAGPGFINFYLSKKFFAKSLNEVIQGGELFGRNTNLRGQKVLVEHTQPNPFKTFHIGHLMNNAIGESISRILRASGADVRAVSYHGDVGLHVAKTIWGKVKRPELSWGEAYTFGSQNFEANKDEIVSINKKIYQKTDKSINDLYEKGRKESLEIFAKTYERLGSVFHSHFYESDAGEVGKKLVLSNVGKVFTESEGAIVFKGEEFDPKTHTRVFLSSDRLPTYEAKELGLAKMKRSKWLFWKYDHSLTITANEQDSFFDVLEVAIGEIFPKLKGKLKHLSHGLLKLTTGKMSSRTGDVITAEALIEEVKEKVKGDEAVAIGAIKYMILRSNIGGDIVFDIEKSVSTEGDSGVYLQYAHARASSLLEKAKAKGQILSTDSQGLTLRETHEIEKILYRFPEVVERAEKEYAPHHLTTYLTELASSFNNFYAHEEVIGDSPESAYRLAVVEAFKIVMKNGLYLLGIKAPERM